MTAPGTRSVLQRVSLLVLNIPATERTAVLEALAADTRPAVEPHTEEVMQACRNALKSCAPGEPRRGLLHAAGEVAALLEQQKAAYTGRHCEALIVGTIPEFLYRTSQAGLPPINHGSLESEVIRIANAARQHLDITIPYISHSGVDILTVGLKRGSRPGLHLRILSLLTTPHRKQNNMGVHRLMRRFELAGATVDVRSPTDQEASSTGAIAVMHAKVLIADRKLGYLGTANISKAALMRGFEVGVIVEGELAENLWRLNDWVFTRHQRWEGIRQTAPARPARL
jgi:phosphatidylserine/phosphatidylglycerophosphate/cardiolipin synthase-like enzyme